MHFDLNRSRILSAIACGLMLVCGEVQPLTAQDEPAAPPAKIETAKPAKKTAGPLAPPKADEDGIPLVEVPEGTPEDLAAFIEKIQSVMPKGLNEEQAQVYIPRVMAAIEKAADQILASDAEAATLTTAARGKFMVLSSSAQSGSKGAGAAMDAYIKSLASDPRPALVDEAKGYGLVRRLQSTDMSSAKARTMLTAAVKKWVTESPAPNDLHFALANNCLQVLEKAQEFKLAAAEAKVYSAIFAKNADKGIAVQGKKMAGAARRWELPGKTMEIKGTLLSGKPFDAAKYKGKVVLVDFWATWCGPCIAELPNVLRNYQRYHDKGFEVIGISLDDDRAPLDDFLASNKLPWPIIFDANGFDQVTADYYGVAAIPTVILLDQSGKVVSLDARAENLGELLEKLLGPVEDATEAAASETTEEAAAE